MNDCVNSRLNGHGKNRQAQAAILVVVLWITFGLISMALYFAHSMMFELRGSDNRVAAVEADQAIEGARRYLSCVLSNVNTVGAMPDPTTYANEAIPVGNAHFWLIGRSDDTSSPTTPHFGLIDESSKLNINTATSNVLMNLPRMTPDLVANILAWRSTNVNSLSGGAESDTYMQLAQPYFCKNAPFETIEELKMVYEMDEETLYGEDANLNGVLDPNENDGDALPPSDNLDGVLDPGLLEYCTVYSREPSTTTNGTTRLNLSTLTPNSRTQLVNALTNSGISASRAATIAGAVIGAIATSPITSTLQFYYISGMSTTEFMQVEPNIRGASIVGLVNVNTASLAVLSCLPGLTNGQAAQIISYRQANTNTLNAQPPSLIWLTQTGLGPADLTPAAPYLTGRSYQYMADVAAIGHNGRGYRRTRFIFDTSQGAPIILHRQDLSQLGWALGKAVRDKWLLAKE
jgi:DNA uptake protein ComE-like DNA-binding protein